jgi:hypothetical protein
MGIQNKEYVLPTCYCGTGKEEVEVPIMASLPEGNYWALIEKKHFQKWWLGRIVGVEVNQDTGEFLWEIQYDDDEFEFCDAREIQALMV